MKNIKKIIAGTTMAALMVMSATAAFAAEITGTTGQSQLNINIEPTIISATVPTTITANIDPNKEVVDYTGDTTTDTKDTFVAPLITVENKSNAPIVVKVDSVTAQEGSPNLVKQDKFTDEQWKNLNRANSAANFALGFVDSTNGWHNPGEQYLIGTVNRKDSVSFGLKAKYGLAHQEVKNLAYSVVYELSLA